MTRGAMTRGAIALEEWARARRASDSQLAAALGVERTTVSRIRRGERRPAPALAMRIRALTGVDFAEPGAAAAPPAAPLDAFTEAVCAMLVLLEPPQRRRIGHALAAADDDAAAAAPSPAAG